MPRAYSTIALASSTRMRTGNHSKKAAPLTAGQLEEKRAARNDKQARIDARVQQWMESTNELAQSMATEFDMQPRYFLDIFFQGGAHMINHQEAVNPYNTFRGLKSMEARGQGLVMNAPDLHTHYFDEYSKLTTQEKEQLCTKWEEIRSTNFQLRRDTPRAKIQDVANVHSALAQRVGVEGFFCIVKNNVHFRMDPEWYFTSRSLSNLLRTSKQKTDWMKGEICSLLGKNLVEVSKVDDARLGCVSRPIITSEDERDDDPEADAENNHPPS
ncbi:hypothetical protein GGX14DRAFT_568713 [Mycena pura]|uniref:Uncharacterized protein n=1 Tax=Mycena pura TaxID=153505 RepID=A0AAD6VCF8_9AGAR|nr:hypothetical protein GGX14DRAFT_568713 [Mycena pura]